MWPDRKVRRKIAIRGRIWSCMMNFDNKEMKTATIQSSHPQRDEVKTRQMYGKKISCQKPKRYRHRQRKKPKHPQNPGSSHLFTITATKEANRQSRQAAHRTHSSMVHQSIIQQKSILTKKERIPSVLSEWRVSPERRRMA